MRLVPLGSGSRGNATLVELAGKRLLVDAGLPAQSLARRLEAVRVAPEQVDFLLLTHEHEDHARGAELFSRRYRVPLVCSWQTLEALDASPAHFAAFEPIGLEVRDLDGPRVEPFAVPHDARAPIGFVLHGEGLRIGFATDLGHAPRAVAERLRGCQVLVIEANHDDRMLAEGPYPPALKRRVAGRLGHLSNREAAALLGDAVDGQCHTVVLAHLSEQNNTPSLARREAERALRTIWGVGVALHVAAAAAPSVEVRL